MEFCQVLVILTGSQLPWSVIRTDAKRNLITAIEIAASKKLVPEVCIYFNSQLFRGNRAEKFTSSKFDAFQSLNFPVLAEAGSWEMVFDERIDLTKTQKEIQINRGFNEHVLVLKLFPGLSPSN
ncbi:MAG: asparaginase [Bacteroidetes bacterium]|nr:asparaginase [Bacteroidota bacterium]